MIPGMLGSSVSINRRVNGEGLGARVVLSFISIHPLSPPFLSLFSSLPPSLSRPPSLFERLLTFLLHCVPPHVEVIKRSQSDEPNKTVEIFELILDGGARYCPTVVCGGEGEGEKMKRKAKKEKMKREEKDRGRMESKEGLERRKLRKKDEKREEGEREKERRREEGGDEGSYREHIQE